VETPEEAKLHGTVYKGSEAARVRNSDGDDSVGDMVGLPPFHPGVQSKRGRRKSAMTDISIEV
jgi:hypothetical protein